MDFGMVLVSAWAIGATAIIIYWWVTYPKRPVIYQDQKRNQWKPWAIPQDGPPCVSCRHWRPQFNYRGEVADGITCCHSQEMFHDFSCYRERLK